MSGPPPCHNRSAALMPRAGHARPLQLYDKKQVPTFYRGYLLFFYHSAALSGVAMPNCSLNRRSTSAST